MSDVTKSNSGAYLVATCTRFCRQRRICATIEISIYRGATGRSCIRAMCRRDFAASDYQADVNSCVNVQHDMVSPFCRVYLRDPAYSVYTCVSNRFAANVTINMALAQTSVSSVTILSSLSGLFTLVLGSIFGIERFNSIRLMAVAASIVGVILVSKADDGIIPADTKGRIANDPRIPKHAIMGDLLAILSALFYAMYTLLLKAKTGDETRIS